MTKTNGETLLSFFPTPYPDETIYSVLCRFYLQQGRPSYRQLCEKLFGHRQYIFLNTYAPQCIGKLASYLPEDTMLSAEYLIRHTTMFPYFSPFLSLERKNTFIKYMVNDEIHKKNTYLSMGTGSLRQPKNLYLRFCKSCWREDIQERGEPYWRRIHQLPGVLLCHQHGEPLWDSPVLITLANLGFYPASADMIAKGSVCGDFNSGIAEKLTLLSKSSQWLLDNGSIYGPYEQVYTKYDSWLLNAGYSTLSGQTWHHKIYYAVNDLYSRDLLKLVGAYDSDATNSWISRIMYLPSSLQHPMYHILLHILLAGSTSEFLNGDCQKPLPYGNGPWPCRNPVCPHNLVDVIENIDIHYFQGLPRALFKCPYCGFAYRRQSPTPKEKQYAGKIYIDSYGELWRQKLREYIVDQGLSARRTCEYLQCDMYTVQKYAVKFGYMKPEDTTAYEKYVPKPTRNVIKPVLPEKEIRGKWRQTWKQLVTNNPGAYRTYLKKLAPSCYRWLSKNDQLWFNKHLPASQSACHFDWVARDDEMLGRIMDAVNILRVKDGRPVRITLHRIAVLVGVTQLTTKSLSRIPKTAAYLSENLESFEDWRKRKIIWAIRHLRNSKETITLTNVVVAAEIEYPLVHELHEFIMENLKRGEISKN